MESSFLSEIDNQLICIKQALSAANNLKKKCIQLEREKNEALEKCAEMKAEIERRNKEGCTNCDVLTNKLLRERKERERLKKEEKAKLLKTIAKTLDSIDDASSNQLTNAQQLYTQLVCCGSEDSPERKAKKNISLFEDNDTSDEENSKVLVNETVIEIESEESNDGKSKFVPQVVVPETQPIMNLMLPSNKESSNQQYRPERTVKTYSNRVSNVNSVKNDMLSPEKDIELQPKSKKLKYSPTLTKQSLGESSKTTIKNYNHSPLRALEMDPDKTLVNNLQDRSPSVLSEMTEKMEDSSTPRSIPSNNVQEEKETKWKMKPSFNVDSNTNAANGKKLKQMTLNVARAEKKLDISLSEGFKGGVTTNQKKFISIQKDMVLPSPERSTGRKFSKKIQPCETMEDPDLTVFQPPITSTCLPMETSFDRLPVQQKSPPYKYRRDTVRKKDERMKLPGQNCDECIKYMEAAGLDKTQDIEERLNMCSKHRDKYQIRANTPPGFWDPVLPVTPEGSQELAS